MDEHLTPSQRTLRARTAAYVRWGRTTPAERKTVATAGQEGLRNRFVREVEAEHPGLADTDVQKMADARLKAHMSRIAFRSSKARTSGEAA